jgi:hypothetical protein
MSGNYLLKMEQVKELNDLYKRIEANRQAGEILLSALTYVNRFCDQNGITPPDANKMIDAMEKLKALMKTDDSYHDKSSDGKLPKPERLTLK